MPSASITLLESPLKYVDDTFEKLVHQSDSAPESIVKQIFEIDAKVFEDENVRTKIPLLDFNSKSGSLVRFRAMLQDMHGTEFYLSSYKTRHTSKHGIVNQHCGILRDNAYCPPEHELVDPSLTSPNTGERHLFTFVSIPAQTPWVKEFETPQTDVEMVEPAVKDSVVFKSIKSCIPIEKDTNSTLTCFTKIYDGGDNLKLNESVEMVGILFSANSSTEDNEKETHSDFDLLPRLHVIYWTPLAHNNPTLPLSADFSQLSMGIAHLRAKLMQLFTDFLAGDTIAAEYLLCHLISCVHLRHDVMAVGKFSLNIFGPNVNTSFGLELQKILEKLSTKLFYLPLSVSQLNSVPYTPKKDYSTERLQSGCLQLANGTQMIIDESTMEAGQLNDCGVRNVAALRSIIGRQQMDYDFHYHTCAFSTDYNVLIVSEGKSMLESDCAVKLEPKSGHTLPGAIPEISKQELTVLRQYLTAARRAAYDIPEEIRKEIESDFVLLRKNGQNVTAEHLHATLLLARLLSISKGKEKLELEVWKRAKVMEQIRNDRLSTNV